MNKSIWIKIDSEIFSKIEKMSKGLNLSVAEFSRSAIFSTFLRLQEFGIEKIELLPFREGKMFKFILKKKNEKTKK